MQQALVRFIKLTIVALGLALALGAALLGPGVRPAAAQDAAAATTPLTATVVVQTERGLYIRPITFTGAISGLAALEASGLPVTVADTNFGAAVCAIASTGCPADNCFCSSDHFWNYSAWNGEAWASYAVGAGDAVLTQTAAIEGWRWGVFTGTAASPVGIVDAVPAALTWLRGQQAANGGYGGMGAAAETLFAIGANGLAARDWATPAGSDLQTYARVQQTKFARTDAAAAGKVALGLAAADACWNGRSRLPMSFFDATLGAYSADSGRNAWGFLGTLALSETVPASAVDALRTSILPVGGWEWQAGFGADSNTTALAIQALVAAGAPITTTEVVSGLAFLAQAQQPDGGFAYDLTSGTGSDANSTAYAVQAIAAVGQDPAGDVWSAQGNTPIGFLLSLQLADGSFAWQPGGEANLFATQQAIPALLQHPYPIAVRPVERCTWQ